MDKHRLFEKEELAGLKKIFLERRRREEKYYSDKDDKDIIIINIVDEDEKKRRKDKRSKSRSSSSKMKESHRKRDFLMAEFLAIIAASSFFFIQSVFRIVHTYIPTILPSIDILFIGLIEYNELFIFFILLITVLLFLGYFTSSRVKSYTTNKFSQKNAFLEFLSLIEKDERGKLLNNMANTAREILISGIVDLLDPTTHSKSDIRDTIKDGIGFVSKFFAGGEEEED